VNGTALQQLTLRVPNALRTSVNGNRTFVVEHSKVTSHNVCRILKWNVHVPLNRITKPTNIQGRIEFREHSEITFW